MVEVGVTMVMTTLFFSLFLMEVTYLISALFRWGTALVLIIWGCRLQRKMSSNDDLARLARVLTRRLALSGVLVIIGSLTQVVVIYWCSVKPGRFIGFWIVYASAQITSFLQLSVFSPNKSSTRRASIVGQKPGATTYGKRGSISKQINRGSCILLFRHVHEKLDSKAKQDDSFIPYNLREKMNDNADYIPEASERFAFTTADVTFLEVKTETLEQQCPYVALFEELTDGKGSPMVGTSSFFVSHSWLQLFSVLLSTIESFRRDQGNNIYFWFDCFAINQHMVNKEGELDQLSDTVRACGSLLLVANPWNKPLPLTRVWCLYELHTAAKSEVPIKLHISSDEKDAFLKAVDRSYETVVQALMDVKTQNATATVLSDRDMIFKQIENEGGFDKFDETIKGVMNNSLSNFVITNSLPTM
eukprot:gnl/MRDRNA2_/MRDRNA2_33040_c0_seq1.p1 gnl/MRDRNA2_/MRDRNA2_33040_c0~~gnl/MRDRNA2_/MRDRNA2_33040_c0_seq1.p1  ORF type:complete len:463 (+),score=21.04 gnl/MRDRNA2_/MRDRNA2_33040_c0_seq1:141-1391(+)